MNKKVGKTLFWLLCFVVLFSTFGVGSVSADISKTINIIELGDSKSDDVLTPVTPIIQEENIQTMDMFPMSTGTDKYSYEVFYSQYSTVYMDIAPWTSIGQGPISAGSLYSRTYSYDGSTNRYFINTTVTFPELAVGDIFYSVNYNNQSLLEYTLISYDGTYATVSQRQKNASGNYFTWIKGSKIATIESVGDIFPDNGRHTDGYWYTKRVQLAYSGQKRQFLKYAAEIVAYRDDSEWINYGIYTGTKCASGNYQFDSSTNIYSVSGGSCSNGTAFQLNGNGTLEKYVGDGSSYTRYFKNPIYNSKLYKKGVQLGPVELMDDGTYPVDGAHTDGYWYSRSTLTPVTSKQFNYSKYNVVYTWADSAPWVYLETVGGPFCNLSSAYGYDAATNTYSAGTSECINGANGTVGYNATPGVLYKNVYSTSGTKTRYTRTAADNDKAWTKGTLVQSNIVALDGTYPNDALHPDGFWYVKGAEYYTAPTAVTVSAPAAGTVITNNANITWTASTSSTKTAAQMQYEVSLSTNNGTSWTVITPLTSAGQTTLSYNFANEVASTQARVRVRPYDGTSYGSYAQSTIFTIAKNYMYDKFAVEELWNDDAPWHYQNTGVQFTMTNYIFDRVTNKYSGKGDPIVVHSDSVSPHSIFYRYENHTGYLYRYVKGSANASPFSVYVRYPHENTKSTEKTELVQQNIIALDGTYPNNGIHTDGFWYVKGGLQTTAPVLAVINPSTNIVVSAATGKNTITLTGTVSDPKNANVTVSATLNGKLKSVNVTGTSTAKSWTLTWVTTTDSLVDGNYTGLNISATNGTDTVTKSYLGSIIVDKTPPVISLGDINGKVFSELTPPVNVTDNLTGIATQAVTLNGAPYTLGTEINTPGTYTLAVTATDGAGNQSTSSVTFVINAAPTLTVTPSSNGQSISKRAGNKEIDFAAQARDESGTDTVKLYYSVDEGPTIQVGTYSVVGGVVPISEKIDLSSYSPGNHNIKYWVEDSHGATSSKVTNAFTVLNYRPVLEVTTAPSKVWLNSYNKFTSKDGSGAENGQISLTGTVIDEDGDVPTVNVSVGSINLPATVTGNDWAITIDGTDLESLSNGEYDLTLTSSDNVPEEHSLPGIGDHTKLLSDLIEVDRVVPTLTNYVLRKNSSSFEIVPTFSKSDLTVYLSEDSEVTWASDLTVTQGGIKNLRYNDLAGNIGTSIITINNYNNLVTYVVDIEEEGRDTTESDIDRLNLVIDEVDQYLQSNLVNAAIYDSVKTQINTLVNGNTKITLLTSVRQFTVDEILKDPALATSTLLADLGFANVRASVDYSNPLVLYKGDVATLVESDIDLVISKVNIAEDGKNTVTIRDARNSVSELIAGDLKDLLYQRLVAQALTYLHNNTETIVLEDLDHIELERVDLNSLEQYRESFTLYKGSVEPTQSEAQVVVDITNYYVNFVKNIHNVTPAELSEFKSELSSLETGSNLLAQYEEVTNVVEELLKLTQNGGISEYDSVTTLVTSVELEDAKKVFDEILSVVDSVVKAEVSYSMADILDAINTVKDLEDGVFKSNLQIRVTEFDHVFNVLDLVEEIFDNLPQLTEAVLDNLKSSIDTLPSGKVIKNDLAEVEQALRKLLVVVDNLEESSLVDARTSVTDAVNNTLADKANELLTVIGFVIDALDSYDLDDISKARADVDSLEVGPVKTKLQEGLKPLELVDQVLNHVERVIDGIENLNKQMIDDLRDHVKTLPDGKKIKEGLLDLVDAIEAVYNTVTSLDKSDLNNAKTLTDSIVDADAKKVLGDILEVIEAIIKAREDLTRDSLDKAKDLIDEMEEGTLKDRFEEEYIQIVLDRINNDPSTIVQDDPKDLGIVVIPDNLDEYRDNLEQYKEDLGRDLTKEDIKQIVDLTDLYEKTKGSSSTTDLNNLQKEIDKLKTGKLKKEMSDTVTKRKDDLNTSSGGSGGGGGAVAETTPVNTEDFLKTADPKQNLVLESDTAIIRFSFSKTSVLVDEPVTISGGVLAKEDIEEGLLRVFRTKSPTLASLTLSKSVLETSRELVVEVPVKNVKRGDITEFEEIIRAKEVGKFTYSAEYIEKDVSTLSNSVDLDVTHKAFFEDVPNGAWFSKYVNGIASKNIVNGEVKNGKRYFYPLRGATRAESLVVILNALGITVESGTDAMFTDLGGKWYKDAANIGKRRNLVSGYLDGTFRGDTKVTRAEFSQMLVTAFEIKGETELKFTDVSKDSWYYDAVSKLYAAGIVSGVSETTFSPNKFITRAEMATMIYNVLN